MTSAAVISCECPRESLEDVADGRSGFSYFFLFVLSMKIVGLLTVNHVIDALAIVVLY